ncbi:hypothetical protein AB0N73_14755 [Microbacterium sp. NPDC089189]|uniref:hypothetical protein n=1 Tax=Microbacterium sp. NPDC089189 TaxID=3154972 RepID=UPI0034237EE8
MSHEDWTLRPRVGLGRLVFGMSAAEVDALSDVYGTVTARGNDRAADALLLETLEMFGGAMSSEEKAALVAAYAENGPDADAVTETRDESGLVLSYAGDRLVGIMSPLADRPLLIDGHDLRALSARDALALLERLNGGPGRYADTETAFDALALSVDGFSVVDRYRRVRTIDPTDERFARRTATVLPHPAPPADAELRRRPPVERGRE